MRSSLRSALTSLALCGLLFACGGASSSGDTADGQGETLGVAATCELTRERMQVLERRVQAIDTESQPGPEMFSEFGASFRELERELDRPVVEEAQPMVTAFRDHARQIAEVSEGLARRTTEMLAAPARLEELGQVLEPIGERLRGACQPATPSCVEVGTALQAMEFNTTALDATIRALGVIEPPPQEGALRDIIQAYLTPLREMRDIAAALETYNAELERFQAATEALGALPEAAALCEDRSSGGEAP